MLNFFGCYFDSRNHLKSPRDELAEATKQIHAAYIKVIDEFHRTLAILISSKDINVKENCLLELDTTIDGSLFKIKCLRKKFFSGKDSEFFQIINSLLQSLLQDLPVFGSHYETLGGPLQKFKNDLKFDSDILTQDSKRTKGYQEETQMQTVQQQLNLIKETYDLTISSFVGYLKSLQSQTSDLRSQESNLELVIDTAFVQFRSIRNKFPQSYSQYLSATFEGMKQDFSKFRSVIPPKFFFEVSPFIEKFEEIINLDRAKEKDVLPQKSEIVEQTKRNSYNNKGQEDFKITPASLKKSYDAVKKSMLECIQAFENKKNTKGTLSSKQSNLAANIQAADEKFKSVRGSFSHTEVKSLFAAFQDMSNDWNKVDKKIPTRHWGSLSKYYFDFSNSLRNFENKVYSIF